MLILNDQLNYLLDPFTKALAGGVNLALKSYIKQQQLQERANQIMRLFSQALSEIPPPKETYVLEQPSTTLQVPDLNFKLSDTESAEEKLKRGLWGNVFSDDTGNIQGGGLLGNIFLKQKQTDNTKSVDEKSGLLGDLSLATGGSKQTEPTTVEIMKDPVEYLTEVYQRTLPIIVQARVLGGVNVAPFIGKLLDIYTKEYKRVEDKESLAEKIDKYKNALLKLFPDIDEETASLLADAGANKLLDFSDLLRMHEKNVILQHVTLPDGRVVFVAVDKKTGEVKWMKEIQADINALEKLWRAKERIKQEEKAKWKNQTRGTGGEEKPRLVKMKIESSEVIALKKELEEAKKRNDEETVARILMELQKCKLFGNCEQEVYLLYYPKAKKFTTVGGIPVDIYKPESILKALEQERGLNQKSGGNTQGQSGKKKKYNPWTDPSIWGNTNGGR